MAKTIILFLVLVTFNKHASAQNTVTVDAETIDKYGNIYTIGSFEGAIKSDNFILGSAGSSDIYISKYNKNGTCQWINSAGGSKYDSGTGIVVDKDGYVYICGNFTDTASFDYITIKGKGEYCFVAKYNPSGDIIWVKSAIGANSYDIAIDGSNYVYITGSYVGTTNFGNISLKSVGETDGFIAKYFPSGKIDWVKSFGGSGNDVGMSIDIIPGSLIVGGSFSLSATFSDRSINGGRSDGFLVNYTTSGTINWLENSGFSEKTAVYDCKFTKKSNILSAWQSIINSSLKTSILVHSGSDGKLLNKKTFEGNSYPTSVAISDNEDIMITGSYKDKLMLNSNKSINPDGSDYGYDFFITKINVNNSVEWVINSGYTKDDCGKDIILDAEKNIIAIGEFSGVAKFGKIELQNSGNTCVFLTKINQQGDIIWAKKAIEPEPNFDSNSKKYRNIFAKILVGETEKKSIINQVVNLKNNDGEIIRSTTTDLFGDFSFKSIEDGKQVNIEIEKNSEVKEDVIYIANQSGNVITKIQRNKDNNFSYNILPHDFDNLVAMPEEENINLKIKDFKKSNDNEITVIQNIYFDSNSIKISKEEEKKIAEVAKILRTNLTYYVEIIAHTDSDGDDNSNLILSEKRAKAVADLMATKGIKATNISSKGMGETKILNRCLNGIDCSDKEKMLNRRTEFKIYKVKPANETTTTKKKAK